MLRAPDPEPAEFDNASDDPDWHERPPAEWPDWTDTVPYRLPVTARGGCP